MFRVFLRRTAYRQSIQAHRSVLRYAKVIPSSNHYSFSPKSNLEQIHQDSTIVPKTGDSYAVIPNEESQNHQNDGITANVAGDLQDIEIENLTSEFKDAEAIEEADGEISKEIVKPVQDNQDTHAPSEDLVLSQEVAEYPSTEQTLPEVEQGSNEQDSIEQESRNPDPIEDGFSMQESIAQSTAQGQIAQESIEPLHSPEEATNSESIGQYLSNPKTEDDELSNTVSARIDAENLSEQPVETVRSVNLPTYKVDFQAANDDSLSGERSSSGLGEGSPLNADMGPQADLPTSMAADETIRKQDLEDLVGYQFKDDTFLALRNHNLRDYLALIGDQVLKTVYIRHNWPQVRVGRNDKAAVLEHLDCYHSNKELGRLAEATGLLDLLLSDSRAGLSEHTKGTIFESVIGGVLVDSQNDLNAAGSVWKTLLIKAESRRAIIDHERATIKPDQTDEAPDFDTAALGSASAKRMGLPDDSSLSLPEQTGEALYPTTEVRGPVTRKRTGLPDDASSLPRPTKAAVQPDDGWMTWKRVFEDHIGWKFRDPSILHAVYSGNPCTIKGQSMRHSPLTQLATVGSNVISLLIHCVNLDVEHNEAHRVAKGLIEHLNTCTAMNKSFSGTAGHRKWRAFIGAIYIDCEHHLDSVKRILERILSRGQKEEMTGSPLEWKNLLKLTNLGSPLADNTAALVPTSIDGTASELAPALSSTSITSSTKGSYEERDSSAAIISIFLMNVYVQQRRILSALEGHHPPNRASLLQELRTHVEDGHDPRMILAAVLKRIGNINSTDSTVDTDLMHLYVRERQFVASLKGDGLLTSGPLGEELETQVKNGANPNMLIASALEETVLVSGALEQLKLEGKPESYTLESLIRFEEIARELAGHSRETRPQSYTYKKDFESRLGLAGQSVNTVIRAMEKARDEAVRTRSSAETNSGIAVSADGSKFAKRIRRLASHLREPYPPYDKIKAEFERRLAAAGQSISMVNETLNREIIEARTVRTARRAQGSSKEISKAPMTVPADSQSTSSTADIISIHEELVLTEAKVKTEIFDEDAEMERLLAASPEELKTFKLNV